MNLHMYQRLEMINKAAFLLRKKGYYLVEYLFKIRW